MIIFTVKASILLLYLKIFMPIRKMGVLSVNIYVVLIYYILFYVIITFLTIFQCSPKEKAWNLLILDGYCLDINAATLASGIINIISDFALLLLPQGVIWKL